MITNKDPGFFAWLAAGFCDATGVPRDFPEKSLNMALSKATRDGTRPLLMMVAGSTCSAEQFLGSRSHGNENASSKFSSLIAVGYIVIWQL